jgi:hypothetical protein
MFTAGCRFSPEDGPSKQTTQGAPGILTLPGCPNEVCFVVETLDLSRLVEETLSPCPRGAG